MVKSRSVLSSGASVPIEDPTQLAHGCVYQASFQNPTLLRVFLGGEFGGSNNA
jgi:hypothetical protein